MGEAVERLGIAAGIGMRLAGAAPIGLVDLAGAGVGRDRQLAIEALLLGHRRSRCFSRPSSGSSHAAGTGVP